MATPRTLPFDLNSTLTDNFEGIANLMVGDRKHDIRAAQRNGASAIGVLWGYGSRDELDEAGADALISSPAEFRAGPAQIQAASS